MEKHYNLQILEDINLDKERYGNFVHLSVLTKDTLKKTYIQNGWKYEDAV